LVPGEWYELEGSFLNLGGGNILATGFLQDYGTSGVIPGSVVYSFPSTVLTSADIAADPTVYAALRGFKNDGLNTVDNFIGYSVVPEPGTISLVLLGLTAFAVRGRKQKN
jgi:PEP-CTERM motif